MRHCRKVSNTKEFIEKAQKVHGDKYDYSKVNYLNNRTKVLIGCYKHGDFLITPNHHLSGSKCKFCSIEEEKIKKTLTTEEFIIKAKKRHGNKYDYSKANYVNSTTKVCIICPIHGEFWQSPSAHIAKHGCQKCGNVYRPSSEEFILKAKQVHGDKYDYSKVEYKTAYKKVCIICPIHGEFWQTPHDHITNKNGCNLCNISKLETQICLLLKHHNIEFVQQYKPKWLGRQSLDFYLPKYNIGIECQGKQHFVEISHFGGKSEFQKIQQRDDKKLKLCNSYGVKLLYFAKQTYTNIENFFTEENLLLEEIMKYGKN